MTTAPGSSFVRAMLEQRLVLLLLRVEEDDVEHVVDLGQRLESVALDQIRRVVEPGLGDVPPPRFALRRIVLERENTAAQMPDARGEPDGRVAARAADLEHLAVGLRGDEGEEELSRACARPAATAAAEGSPASRSARSSSSSRASTALMRSSITSAILSRFDLVPHETVGAVVVDDPHRLHRRVHGRRADEAEARLAEALRQLDGLRRLREPLLRDRAVAAVLPDQLVQRRRLAQRDRRARVRDRRLDLAAVADDPGVAEQPLDVALVERPRPSPGRSRRMRSGSSPACAGSSARRARTGSLRGRAARRCRPRR